MQPIITIFCSFTRLWAIDRFIEDMKSLQYDPALINLAFIIDADEPVIKSQLEALGREGGYRNCLIEMNSDWLPNEVRIGVRRQRIAEVKNQSKRMIAKLDGEYIVGLEDDTIFKDVDLRQLLSPLILNGGDIGFVEGVQCGRWGVRMVGVWQVDDLIAPTTARTLLPPIEQCDCYDYDCLNVNFGYQKIDAGGFYGYATRKELYLGHDYYGSSTQPWGPDVNFGLWVRLQGYRCLVYWPLEFGHDDHGSVAWPSSEKLAQVIYTKDGVTGQWDRSDIESA